MPGCQCSVVWGVCGRPAVAKKPVSHGAKGPTRWRYCCENCAAQLRRIHPRLRLVPLPVEAPAEARL